MLALKMAVPKSTQLGDTPIPPELLDLLVDFIGWETFSKNLWSIVAVVLWCIDVTPASADAL